MAKTFEKTIEDNLDFIINEMQRCAVNQFDYNGWSFSKQDKIKMLIYNSFALRASYDVFKKLKLSTFLGKTYTKKLFDIFIQRNDYDLFQFLFVDSLEDNPTPEINSLKEIKKGIDKTLNYLKFMKKSIYQSFYFRDDIKEKFPKLEDDIHNLIGDVNCVFDGREICMRKPLFTLYWSISEQKYTQVMDKISVFLKENNLHDLMCFKIKDETSEEQVVGNIEIINDY